MRKLLLFLFMVVSILACLPAAPSWAVELNINGDFRVRGFYNNNLTDANNSIRDHNAYNTERFILNLEAKSGQGPINVQGVLTTDFTSFNGTGNSRLGQFPFGPASSANTLCPTQTSPTTPATSTSCSQNTFSLLQAYLKVNTPYANFAVGRQVFKLGLGLIVADAVDAFVLDVPIGTSAKVTLGDLMIFNSTRAATSGGVFVGNGSGGITGANTDLYLVNLNWKPAKETKVDIFASLYTDRGTNFITQVSPNLPALPVQGAANATAGIYGIAAETKQAPFHGIFEADLIRGVVTTPLSRGELLQGHNIVAGADMDVGRANFGLTLVYSSGQDAGDVTSGKRANINGINGDFPLGIITTNVGARSAAPVDGTCPSFTGTGLGGRPGCFGGSGLVTAKFAASYTPPTLPKVNLEFDVLYDRASRQRPIQPAAGMVFLKGGDYIGTELDFFLRYAITKEMSFTAGWGILFAGNYFEAPSAATIGIGNNPTTQKADDLTIGILELRYQF